MPTEKPPSSRKSRIVREIGYYAALIGIILMFRAVIAENYVIPSGSMEPTLKVGDYLFALKCAYGLHVPFTGEYAVRWADVQRGDIVIFPSVEGPRPWLFGIKRTDKLIKRVIGLPGDEIRISHDRVLINEEPLPIEEVPPTDGLYDLDDASLKDLFVERVGDEEHYVFHFKGKRVADSWPPVKVPEGKLFVMGDNRDQSRDSRYFGFVPEKSVLGRAGIIYMSLDKSNGFPWRIRYERLGRVVH